MFAELLEGCRRALQRKQSSLLARLMSRDPLQVLGPLEAKFGPSLPHYRLLLQHGRVVWGAIVQANVNLYAPGDEDLPANTLISPESDFDEYPGSLRSYAERIGGLKGTKPSDPDLAQFAAIVTDEHNYASNEPLPRKLADGHEVYLTSSMIHRACLPQRYLADFLLPMLICPERTFMNLPLPAVFWPQDLVNIFGELDTEALNHTNIPAVNRRPPSMPFPRDPDSLPASEFRTHLLIDVTQRAATALVECAANDGIAQPYFRAEVSPSFNYSLTVEREYDAGGDIVVPTKGIRLVVARSQERRIRGTVIDYRSGAMGAGFMFHNPNNS